MFGNLSTQEMYVPVSQLVVSCNLFSFQVEITNPKFVAITVPDSHCGVMVSYDLM